MALLTIGTWYLYAGAAVAAWFLLFAVGRLDSNAEGAWVFRPLLIPGVLLIWPLVIWRYAVLRRGEERLDRHLMPRAGQDRAVLTMIIAIPIVIAAALLARQDQTTLAAPVLLEAAR
ncbi:MAG: hypothetical protein WA784_14750 [Albidovulum sp.]